MPKWSIPDATHWDTYFNNFSSKSNSASWRRSTAKYIFLIYHVYKIIKHMWYLMGFSQDSKNICKEFINRLLKVLIFHFDITLNSHNINLIWQWIHLYPQCVVKFLTNRDFLKINNYTYMMSMIDTYWRFPQKKCMMAWCR